VGNPVRLFQIRTMLISHHKHFIFIHNYKVAGVSIKRSLSGAKNAAAESGGINYFAETSAENMV